MAFGDREAEGDPRAEEGQPGRSQQHLASTGQTFNEAIETNARLVVYRHMYDKTAKFDEAEGRPWCLVRLWRQHRSSGRSQGAPSVLDISEEEPRPSRSGFCSTTPASSHTLREAQVALADTAERPKGLHRRTCQSSVSAAADVGLARSVEGSVLRAEAVISNSCLLRTFRSECDEHRPTVGATRSRTAGYQQDPRFAAQRVKVPPGRSVTFLPVRSISRWCPGAIVAHTGPRCGEGLSRDGHHKVALPRSLYAWHPGPRRRAETSTVRSSRRSRRKASTESFTPFGKWSHFAGHI